jgi:hypothetical protein
VYEKANNYECGLGAGGMPVFGGDSLVGMLLDGNLKKKENYGVLATFEELVRTSVCPWR